MKKAIISSVCVILVGAAVCFSQSPAMADDQEMGKMGMMPGFGGHRGMENSVENPRPMMMNLPELESLMAEINIDKAASAKIITISRSFLKSFEEKILKIQREELNIKEELLKDKPDLAVIQNAITRKTSVFGEIELAQIKRDLEIKSLLSQDEYDRWKSAMMKRMRKMMPGLLEKQKPNPEDRKAPVQK
jgi:hypothetical protein